MSIVNTTALTAAMAAQPNYIRKIAVRVADAVGVFETISSGLHVPHNVVTPKTKTIVTIRSMAKSSKRGYKPAKHLDTVRALAGQIVKIREARSQRSALRRLPEIAARLEIRRSEAVIRAAKISFRYGAAGGYSFRVRVGEPGYEVVMTANWNLYRGRFKGWAADVDNHVITVPHDWLTKTKRIGRTWVGDCMILSTAPFIEADGRGIFDAVVAVQSRGYSVKIEKRVLSTWPGGIVRAFKNFKQAIADAPPEAPPLVHLPADTDEFLADLAA